MEPWVALQVKCQHKESYIHLLRVLVIHPQQYKTIILRPLTSSHFPSTTMSQNYTAQSPVTGYYITSTKCDVPGQIVATADGKDGIPDGAVSCG